MALRTSGKNRRCQRRRNWIRASMLGGCLAFSLGGWGQAVGQLVDRAEPVATHQIVAADQPLELESAIEMAVANDPEYQKIVWQIEQLGGERYQATRLPNPVASFVGNEIGNEGNAGQYGIQWSQNIVRNGRPCLQANYFDARLSAWQYRFDIRRWELITRISSRFYEISQLARSIEVNRDQLTLLNDIADTVGKLQEAGEVAETDVLNVDLEIQALQQLIREQETQLFAQRQALAVPLGLNSAPIPIASEAVRFDWDARIAEVVKGDEFAWQPEWLAAHPQRLFAVATVEQRQYQVGLARAERCPDVQVQAGINYDAGTDDLFGSLQVGVPLLRNDNKSGLIQAAMAEYQQAVETARQVEMVLQERFAVQAGEVKRFRSRVANLREQIIPTAEKSLGQVRQAYQQGETTYPMLKQGLETLLGARQRLVAAEYELLQADLRLQTLLID